MKDELTNECQQIVMEIFAQNGAKNNANTMAAAQLIGEAFARRIQGRSGGMDSLSQGYARDKLKGILPDYKESKEGVFEDIWSMLRQDSFLFRSLEFVSNLEIDKDKKLAAMLKSLTTWSLAWLQYKEKS
jgi:hypothetical protein